MMVCYPLDDGRFQQRALAINGGSNFLGRAVTEQLNFLGWAVHELPRMGSYWAIKFLGWAFD